VKRLALALLVAAALVAPFSPHPPVTTTPVPATLTVATGGAAYTWHGYNTAYCPDVYTEGCGGASLWEAMLHVAVWANGTDVVMAAHSGYPWCDEQGYNITITQCNWYGGGSEVYAAVHWQNCILVWGLGCWNDTLTVGFNRFGHVNYWHPSWTDSYP
jgi:hypothetical protein